MKWCVLLCVLLITTCFVVTTSPDAVASISEGGVSADLGDAGAFLTLAQAESGSTYSGSSRSRNRGIGKLIGLVVVGVLALGRFIFRMLRGGDS